MHRVSSGFEFTVSITTPELPPVSDEEVAERAREYEYILSTDLPVLKTADEWWSETSHKRRRREGADKAYAWLLPFVSLEIAKLERLQAAQEWGPLGARNLVKAVRAIIREKRKSKEPHQDLLNALYGACVVTHLSDSVRFEGARPLQFININELNEIKIDYAVLGYQCVDALSKTDIKWMVETFGEPAEHQSFDALWPHVKRNAIARYCWSELRQSNKSSTSLGWPEKTMQEWLNEQVKRNIGYHKEWQERVAAREARVAELNATLEASWAATKGPFVVADLETTGLRAETDEVFEVGALKVDSSGAVTEEFACLVRTARPIPPVITKLTGVTQAEIDRDGRSLRDAMKGFVQFVGDAPVFFHNAPFDKGFLERAATSTKQKFTSRVHDTLPMARRVWPSLETYKLATLADHIGCAAPAHRALPDAKATLAVLMAARKATSENGA